MRASRRFPHEPGAISAARAFVSDQLAYLPPDPAFDVELMVSELVTNCIRHTSSDFVLVVEAEADDIRVEVTDSGPGNPRLETPALTQATGRGLHIVDGLSQEWGVSSGADPSHKTVWFTYRVRAGLPHPSRSA